jgi:hypothetical protein
LWYCGGKYESVGNGDIGASNQIPHLHGIQHCIKAELDGVAEESNDLHLKHHSHSQ